MEEILGIPKRSSVDANSASQKCYYGSWRPSLAGRQGDVNSLVHLRNAYIECMKLCTDAEQCVPLLCGVSESLNFKVGRLVYEENLQETDTLERSVEWIVGDLQVAAYELVLGDYGHREQGLIPTTLTHHSVRGTMEHLYANVRFN